MEVGAAAAITGSSVAWDPRKHTINARSLHIRCGHLDGVGVVRVRSTTGVSDEDGVSACLPMRVCRLVQLRKASTIGVIWVAETINERAHQYLNGPAHVRYRDIGFHVLQK
eukprot:9479311-Pyramimonas_sp.AAC.1